jgi:hypothetical protein
MAGFSRFGILLTNHDGTGSRSIVLSTLCNLPPGWHAYPAEGKEQSDAGMAGATCWLISN